MKWYLQVLKDYFMFSGRARRKEYWMFVLFNFIFAFIAATMDLLIMGELGLFYYTYAIVLFLPGLAVSVRRLHDVSKSGWMILVSIIPIIGTIWLLILLATDSVPGTNRYGPNPN